MGQGHGRKIKVLLVGGLKGSVVQERIWTKDDVATMIEQINMQ